MESVEQVMAATVWLDLYGESIIEYGVYGVWDTGVSRQGQNVGVHGGGENYGVLQSMCL